IEQTFERALSECSTLAEAASRILPEVVQYAQADVGMLWGVDRGGDVLRCIDICRAPADTHFELESITRELTITRGQAVTGRVWESRQGLWISDLQQDPQLGQGSIAAIVGLSCVMAFPL